MTEIQTIADRLIREIKEDERLEKVRFVKEYRAQGVETPVADFLAVVSIRKMEQSEEFVGRYLDNGVKGEKFNATICIKIYAPYFENGDGLTEISGVICDALKKCQSGEVIESLNFEPIGFDENINAVYRLCTIKVGFFLCQEAVVK